MALITYSGKQTAQHNDTTVYKLAKIHWSAAPKGKSVTITDGSGVLVASLTDTANDISFNPPKTVTGLRVLGAGAGFLHIYDQSVSGSGF
jgi:hypothetical protein